MCVTPSSLMMASVRLRNRLPAVDDAFCAFLFSSALPLVVIFCAQFARVARLNGASGLID